MVSRLRCFIGGILFCFFTSSFALHATENDDLVKAMMEVYAEELAANPQDYRTRNFFRLSRSVGRLSGHSDYAEVRFPGYS